ncbi:phosphate/phosphite/phosphonate ABC transporter substrate-binding protein [Fructilactobacillus myrtifloralis]|uniref:Phosphate/phosphite/phosphonate ABC transporter substrate-binding protein n=1 Tax=Fructilactobacillus myrtifloralis TaxID=2940301 RepID=A0ABY5BPP8_9LACO|nr:phosphate/phosphite/phosphonate ABC transporter substrate-binding protein [Fructilactobacillus myrtifloralis]USS85663.1 phosphate/phosphite/phosphonate ABC transporter substrate-binding protein [Fructilactobacillus myrtifloralis]
MKVKKLLKVGCLALVLLVIGGGLSGCKHHSRAENYQPKRLVVEFNPSSNAGKMEARAKPLEKMLEQQLHIPVKVVVATSGSSMVEALGSKTADVAFLSPTAYVLGHANYGVKAILQATRYRYGSDATEDITNVPTNTYRGEIVVKKNGKVKKLSDLKGKKIAIQDTTSTAGYIFPAVELADRGINIHKNGIKTFTVKGADQGVLSVYNGNADAAFVFQGARKIAAKDDPNVMKDTAVLYKTQPIPNDTISVRRDMSPKWDKKIARAFQTIAKSKKGHRIIYELYSHQGYVPVQDHEFDSVRTNLKKVGRLDE